MLSFCIYVGNLADEYKENGIQFKEFQVSGDDSISFYDQCVVMDKDNTYIYSIGGTSESLENKMNIHRLDLNTKKWELLHKSCGEGQEPEIMSQQNIFFYKSRIYLMSGDYTDVNYTFSKMYMFDVATKQWQCLTVKEDHRVSGCGYPSERTGYTCVQCPEKSNLVYLCGGRNWDHCLRDVWRFDLDKLLWEELTWCTLPQPISFHYTTVTPKGQMCCYGGYSRVVNEDISTSYYFSEDILSVWITIPKLKVICWEAMLHYFKDQMFQSSDEQLKRIGIPPEFCKRIIEAHGPVQ